MRLLRTCVSIVVIAIFFGIPRAGWSVELTVVPASPRYLEPVYLHIDTFLYPQILSARVSMSGGEIKVEVDSLPELGPAVDVMLGRFPAGTYTVTVQSCSGRACACPSCISTRTTQFTVVPAPTYVPLVDPTGLWWNPNEPGWGLSIFQGPGGELVAVWSTHDPDGNPTWYTVEPAGGTSGGYAIYRTTGSTFTPQRKELVGNALLSLGITQGTFIYTIDGVRYTKPIQRVLLD